MKIQWLVLAVVWMACGAGCDWSPRAPTPSPTAVTAPEPPDADRMYQIVQPIPSEEGDGVQAVVSVTVGHHSVQYGDRDLTRMFVYRDEERRTTCYVAVESTHSHTGVSCVPDATRLAAETDSSGR